MDCFEEIAAATEEIKLLVRLPLKNCSDERPAVRAGFDIDEDNEAEAGDKTLILRSHLVKSRGT